MSRAHIRIIGAQVQNNWMHLYGRRWYIVLLWSVQKVQAGRYKMGAWQ
jgi:hypothetical protein